MSKQKQSVFSQYNNICESMKKDLLEKLDQKISRDAFQQVLQKQKKKFPISVVRVKSGDEERLEIAHKCIYENSVYWFNIEGDSIYVSRSYIESINHEAINFRTDSGVAIKLVLSRLEKGKTSAELGIEVDIPKGIYLFKYLAQNSHDIAERKKLTYIAVESDGFENAARELLHSLVASFNGNNFFSDFSVAVEGEGGFIHLVQLVKEQITPQLFMGQIHESRLVLPERVEA